MYSFRVSTASILKFVPEVCQAIYDVLLEDYLSAPSSTARWQQLVAEFENKWQFPHAVGAIDGKHINMKAPPNSGSGYFNYKKQFSIVLLAIEMHMPNLLQSTFPNIFVARTLKKEKETKILSLILGFSI